MNCYNGEEFLREAIESVYKQTFQDWEIVFWNNASTDSSKEIACSFDSKVCYYEASAKTSLGEARVNAISRANGKNITFLDCDDLWHSNKLERQALMLIKHPDCGFLYSKCNKINKKGENIGLLPYFSKHLPTIDIFEELLKSNFVPFVSVVIPMDKYQSVGGFSSNYKNSMDYDLFLRLSYQYPVYVDNEILCSYRFHENNLSNVQRIDAGKEAIEIVCKFLPDKRIIPLLRVKHRNLAVIYILKGEYIAAANTVIKNKVFILFIVLIIKLAAKGVLNKLGYKK